MTYEAGDVVITPFPFTDMDVSKYRPALVLSAAEDNQRAISTLMDMITSATSSDWVTDIAVHEWRAAGLLDPSIVRPKIFTLDNNLLGRRLGSLAIGDRTKVGEMLRALIAL